MAGDRFYAIDLFAGCGGLSEGFTQAGFKVTAYIERDKWACETLKTRALYYKLKTRKKPYWYFKYLKQEITKEVIYKKFPDIKKEIDLEIIKAEFGEDSFTKIRARLNDVKRYYKIPKFHVVLGGPPCQPYSVIGRARDADRMINDKRHFLYEHYLKILESIQPDFFLFENVPGLLTARSVGQEMFHRILDDFASIKPGYEIAPSFEDFRNKPRNYILDSSQYNIPQRRKRVFLIGYRQTLEARYPAIREIFRKILEKKNKTVFTVDDAVGDLPRLRPGEGNDKWYGPYTRRKDLKDYQEQMRKGSLGVLNHRARNHMKSDLQRYRFFIEYHKNGNGAATLKDLANERPDLMPDHEHLDKFLDRFKVQWWNYPSSTVMAHICKDGHYYIHPDIDQCRSFTVREAARCQSFPDNFNFEGPRTEQFRQVGNAVPPRLAKMIALFILHELEKKL